MLHEIPADDLRDMAIQMLRLGHSSAQVEQDLMAFVARSMLDEETRWDETTAGPALKVERRLMQLAIRAIVRSCARRLGK